MSMYIMPSYSPAKKKATDINALNFNEVKKST